MAHVLADRVMETSSTAGTGAFTLGGAYTGYRAFSSVLSTSDTCRYAIAAVDANGNDSGDWEVGLGTYSGVNTLTRTTVEASSNAGAAVSFAAGNKRVMLGASAAYISYASFRFFITTTPEASESLFIITPAQGEVILFGDDFAGSGAKVRTNPTSSFVLDVKKNGSSVGSITIATNGAVTFVTTGTTVSLVYGDSLEIFAPAVADTTLANVAITLKGTH